MSLINSLILKRYLNTPSIIEAFRKIKRGDFLPEHLKPLSEIDEALPIGEGQTISQPAVVAFMIELLRPKLGGKILDIGSGSGWTTALLAQLTGEEGKVLRFPKPELPPGTKLTGIIDSKDKKVAIIEMNEETYIANLYDIISERYIVKEIKKDEVIIDFNGYFFSLKIGGEDTSNEL